MAQGAPVEAPYAKLDELEPGIGRILAHNPSAFTYYGTQTYLVGTREVAVIDPGPDLPEHIDALDRSGRRPAGRRDHVHAYAPRPQPGCARRWRSDRALRSSAARRSRWKRSVREPMRRSMASTSPDRVLDDGDALEVDGEAVVAVATPGHTSNHLCYAYRAGAVHRRPCDGLVDDCRGPAGRRHGRLYGEPRQAAAPRRPHLLSRARARGDQPAAICPRP